jgi:hypothetical protein
MNGCAISFETASFRLAGGRREILIASPEAKY